MQKVTYTKDIETEITFLRHFFSGYRPQFHYDGQDWVAIYNFIGVVEPVTSGQTVMAYVSFMNPQCHVGKIFPEMKFLVREGQKVIGWGRVTKIIELEESAKRMESKRHDDNGGAI